MCNNDSYRGILLCLFSISLPVILTDGSLTFPHIQIETKLSTLEYITIGVLALVLCIVLSFAMYFLYLRFRMNGRRTRANYSSNNGVIVIHDKPNLTDTTSLLTHTQTDYDDIEDKLLSNRISSYTSFSAYGATDDNVNDSTLMPQ
eukprot:121141_1